MLPLLAQRLLTSWCSLTHRLSQKAPAHQRGSQHCCQYTPPQCHTLQLHPCELQGKESSGMQSVLSWSPRDGPSKPQSSLQKLYHFAQNLFSLQSSPT